MTKFVSDIEARIAILVKQIRFATGSHRKALQGERKKLDAMLEKART